jgi:hypothetical protein
LRALAGNPLRAHFLITSRIAPEIRAKLGPDDPAERLHQWLVLEYDTVASATVARSLMQHNTALFRTAFQDTRAMRFSVIPSDPQYSNTGLMVPGTSIR